MNKNIIVRKLICYCKILIFLSYQFSINNYQDSLQEL
ncbi:hypothetical protein [Magpiepox virus 2]|nr:hypothetical protein [Magpiepox virus 2]